MQDNFNKAVEKHTDSVLATLGSALLNGPTLVDRTNAVEAMVLLAKTTPESAPQVIEALESYASYYKSEGRVVYGSTAMALIELLPVYPQKVFTALKSVLNADGTDHEIESAIMRSMKAYKTTVQPKENGVNI